MDVNSEAREARSRQKNPLFSVCCGGSNATVPCYVWDLALHGRELGFLGTSSLLVAAFGSPWASTSCLQPFLAVKPPCSEPAVLFFSQSLGMAWDWAQISPVFRQCIRA